MKKPEKNAGTDVAERPREAGPQARPEAEDPSETAREPAPAETNRRRETAEGAQQQPAASPDDAEPPKDDEQPRRRRSIFRRPVFWIFVVLVVVGIVAAALYWWFEKRPYATTDDAFIGADIVQVSPQVSGLVVAASVDDNSHVAAGDVLVRIDPASAKAKLASAKAGLEQATAELQQARVGVLQARNQEAETEAKLSALQVTAQNDQDTLTRDLKLQDSSSSPITQKQIDNDRAAARGAEAQAEAGRRAVATAKTAIDVAKAKVTSAQASVDAARSQVEIARIDLDHTTITAPLAGQVVQKNVNIGSFATAGQPMMALVPDSLYVTANFKETQLADIRPGQPVDLHVDAFPDVDFHGKVVSIQNGAGQAFQLLPPQNATGNYVKVVQRVPVRISINAQDLQKYPLGPGMSVVPSIRVR